MKNGVAPSIAVSCFALGALACSASPTGFGSPDAGTSAPPSIIFTDGGGSGHGSSSGTGAGSGSGSAVVTSPPMDSSAPGSNTGSGSAASGGSDAGAGGGVDAGSGNAGDPEPADMVGMTAAHNAARAAVQPAASPSLPSMTWSSTIAASAQAFTTNCVFADTNNAYGSNAFAGTGTSTPEDVVAAWVGEDASYDYATNTCAAGQMCGHYTQVVWRDSVELGCGMTTCTVNSPFSSNGHGTWQLWVCNYSPAGNYVGEKPY